MLEKYSKNKAKKLEKNIKNPNKTHNINTHFFYHTGNMTSYKRVHLQHFVCLESATFCRAGALLFICLTRL